MAVGAGFADGLGYGDNTKAAVIRLGLMEMVKFCEVFYPGMQYALACIYIAWLQFGLQVRYFSILQCTLSLQLLIINYVSC